MPTCSKCKSDKQASDFYKRSERPGGVRYSCKACDRGYEEPKRSSPYKGNLPRKFRMAEWRKGYQDTPRAKYLSYRATAKCRGLEFTLTFEQFMEFWQKPCHYSGRAIKTVGLDRVDNSVGYVYGNVVSCCEDVNRAKRQLSKEDFIALCRDIVRTHDERAGAGKNRPQPAGPALRHIGQVCYDNQQ